MEKDFAQKREECIQWYVERGNNRETAENIVSIKPEEIRRTYDYMLKAKEDAKHIGIREINVAGFNVKKTYLIDE